MKTTGSKSVLTKKAPAPTLVEVRCGHEGCDETTVMPFSRAATGTHRCPEHAKKPGPRTAGAPPEVALDTGTTVVLPNPADAPPPAKRGRKKKPEPTVAAKAEVPDWAKKAAGRDTPAEMAAVPEAAPVTEPAPEAPVRKKGRAPKAKGKPPAKDVPAAVPGSLRAIGDGWLGALRAAGHTPSTISSYANDLEIAYEHLGAETVAAEITERQITGFNISKGVMKTGSGKGKAPPTYTKTRRALRLALTWAEATKLIAKAPYAAKTPA